MEELKKLTIAIEPLMDNRFIVKLHGTDIEDYLIRSYEIYNEGEELIFKTKFIETVNYCFNPKDFFNITRVTIEFLSPVGDIVNGLSFNVKGSNYRRKQSYKSDKLQTNKLRFIIDKESLNLYYTNIKDAE